jgi:hypothetical protein
MKAKFYKGWRIYSSSGGANNGLAQVNAKHPLRVAKLAAAVPDSGNVNIALNYIKRDIDAIEAGNPT